MPEPLQPTPPTADDGTAASSGIGAETAATTVVVVEEPPAPRRRRRWIGWLIALGVLVVLLVVAFVVGDALARQAASAYVRDRVIAVLGLPEDAEVAVDLGEGSLLVQALRGSVDEVTVSIPELTVGGISGSAVLTAEGVPLSETAPVRDLGVVVTLTEDQVRSLSGYLSGIELTSIELGDGVITVGTDLSLVVVTVPVTVDLVPSAAPGGISFAPESITLEDQKVTVEELRSIPFVSELAGSLLASREFCVADSLPGALEVRDVAVVGSELVVTVGASGIALSDPRLTTTGVCP